jgi:choline dehydrogenase
VQHFPKVRSCSSDFRESSATSDANIGTESILVVEYGEVEYARGGFDPPDIIFGGVTTAPRPGLFSFQTLPSPDMKNKTAQPLVGKTVGGSSAVNGMFFDRPSRFDLDAWEQASSSEFDASENKWNWDGVYPYFKKVRLSLGRWKMRLTKSERV